MSVIAAVGLNRTSSLAVTIRRNRGYAVRSIDAMAPGPSVPRYSMPIRTLSKTRPEALMPKGPWWLKPVWALSWLDPIGAPEPHGGVVLAQADQPPS
jgi:hypothetical protein